MRSSASTSRATPQAAFIWQWSAREAKPLPETRIVSLTRETVFRTLYPSLAGQQSCVDCHNKLQPGAQWKLGDVLGALVIDVPAGPFLANTRLQNAGLGLAFFLLLGAVGLYIFILHFRQLAERGATQGRLRRRGGRFRAFAESVPVWFGERDETLRFTSLSTAVNDRWGPRGGAHSGKTRREVV